MTTGSSLTSTPPSSSRHTPLALERPWPAEELPERIEGRFDPISFGRSVWPRRGSTLGTKQNDQGRLCGWLAARGFHDDLPTIN